jgi:hypothetical protein
MRISKAAGPIENGTITRRPDLLSNGTRQLPLPCRVSRMSVTGPSLTSSTTMCS